MRLNSDEYKELARIAAEQELPVSTLLRGWIMRQLRADRQTEELSSDMERRVRALIREEIAQHDATPQRAG